MPTEGLSDALHETLAAFDDAGTPRTTPEVADCLDIGRRATYGRLTRLVEGGLLKTKKVGANARVWWRPPASTAPSDRDEPRTESADVLDRISEGFFGLDTELRFTYLNDRAEELLDRGRDEVLDTPIWDELAPGAIAKDVFRDVLDEQEPQTFEEYYEPLDTWFETHVYPSETGLSVYFNDVSERKARQREFRETKELLEVATTAGDIGLWSWDIETGVTTGDALLAETYGMDPETVTAGTHIDDFVPSIHEEDRDRVRHALREAAARTGEFEAEYRVRDADGAWRWVVARGEVEDDGDGGDDTHLRMNGALIDVTDRRCRERELAERADQQEVVSALGQRALGREDVDSLLVAACDRVTETLQADYAKVLEFRPAEDHLVLRAGVGWEDGWVGEATVGAGRDYQAGYTLRSAEPVVVDDYEAEARFVRSALLTAHDAASGISVAVGPPTRPWGVLSVHATAPRQFSTNDISFVQSVANVLHPAIERRQRESELERQREHLAALNSLNEVVRDIVHAVIEQSTREEIEATVCERLSATDSYLFAWTGEVDARTQTVRLGAEAGVEGYLDDITISVDPDDERSDGPTGRALRTGEIQVTNDIQADSRHDPWREQLETYRCRSSAAIPIRHEGTTYGVLNVYAERPNAFTGRERAVVAQLGEIVGHAIVATERKQALISDEVVELEFVIEDIFQAVDVESNLNDTIRFERVVPVTDGTYLIYGHTTSDGVDAVAEMVETVPFYDDVSVRRDGDAWAFELEVTDPPVLSAISELEGSVEKALVEGGDYRLTVHISPSSDVGSLIKSMMETYPEARLLKRRQLTKRDDGTRFTASGLISTLTPRQRTALEVAYQSGFFEWPRESNGEHVADSLGVSPPTFHQHLRKAEKKIFDSLLSGSPSTPLRE